jgi:hypothetical protein
MLLPKQIRLTQIVIFGKNQLHAALQKLAIYTDMPVLSRLA